MGNRVVPFPKIRAGLADSKMAGGQDTEVISFEKSFVPNNYQLIPKLIPPADRIKRCPHPGCNELAMYTFSWYLTENRNGERVVYVKVHQRREVISCHDQRCIARARNIVRKQFWENAICSLPMRLP
jgi:hypothetical protein